MPVMPTTRRGRFLLYKHRSREREKRVHWRRHRNPADAAHSHNLTNRAIDIIALPKQKVRKYPLHFAEKAMEPWEWLALGWTPPDYKKWGWLGEGDWTPAPPGSRGYPREAVIGYFDRRAKSIPRLHSLPRKPYARTHAELVEANYYPSDFYPSGAPSYRSQHFP